MKYRKLTAGVIAGAAALLAGLGSGVVQAAPAHPAVVTQDISAILPIFGAPITVEVQTGPGGNISSATITPSGGTATASPNRVTYTTTDGSVKVSIKSKGNTQTISARVDNLHMLEDTNGGKWTGFVFGDPATPATADTVTYMVGDTVGDGSGDPTLTITDPVAPIGDGSSAVVTQGVLKTDDEDGKSITGKVVFTSADGSQSRTLSISVRVRTFIPEADDDNESSTSSSVAPGTPITVASLRITLSGLKGVAQTLADAAGPQVWTGFLCDGSKASINYVVGTDGRLTLDPAFSPNIIPDPSKSNTEGNKLDVRWGDHERVQIRSRVDNGMVTISVMDKIRCKGAPDPTVSGPDTVVSGSNGDHHGDHQSGGDQGGKGNGGDD